MENDDLSPSALPSARRIRTHIEWNVLTHIDRARGLTSAVTRSFISPAALLVNVIASTWPGRTSRSASRYATRYVSTRVLPDPAPATMSSGLPWWTTALRCCGFSPSSRVSTSVLMVPASLRARTDGATARHGTPRPLSRDDLGRVVAIRTQVQDHVVGWIAGLP